MKVLHLLVSGGVGGIETLTNSYLDYSKNENLFVFTHAKGKIYEQISKKTETLYCGEMSFLKKYKYILKNMNGVQAIVVHHYSAHNMMLGSLLAKKKSIPLYIYCHSSYRDARERFLNRFAFDYSKKYTKGYIAISDFVKQTLVDIGINPEKIVRIYNAIDVAKFDQKYLNNNEIIFAGRLVEEKGVIVLLKALSILQKKGITFNCKILGDGPELENLKEFVHANSLENKVEFLGNRLDVYNYLSDSMIFVHPAIFEEGFGIAVLEAMCSGLLCIVSNRGAMPELVEENMGYLFPKGDEVSLANCLENALLNPEKIIHFRKNAYEKAKSFTIGKFTSELDSYLKEGIKGEN